MRPITRFYAANLTPEVLTRLAVASRQAMALYRAKAQVNEEGALVTITVGKTELSIVCHQSARVSHPQLAIFARQDGRIPREITTIAAPSVCDYIAAPLLVA